MKALALLATLLLAGCSATSLERGGWVSPTPKKSKYIEVLGGGFVANLRTKTLRMTIIVKAQSYPPDGRYIRVIFPDGRTKEPNESKVVDLELNENIVIDSSPMTQLKYYDSYPVTIQIAGDTSGGMVLDEVIQYVRYELPPSVRRQMGISD